MKKLFEKIKAFLDIIFFSLRLTVQASPKYFSFYILLSVFVIILPFAVIYVSSLLIDLLAGVSENSVRHEMIKSLAVLIVSLLFLNVMSKTVESIKLYLEGLYNEVITIKIKHQIMEKAAGIDLYCFDSHEFYDEINDASNNSTFIIQISFQVLDFIRYFVQFCIAFASLLFWNYILPFFLVISVIPSILMKNKQLESVYSFQREHMKDERKIYYIMNMALSREYAKDIRIYNLFPLLSSKIMNTWNHLYRSKKKITKKYTKILVAADILPEMTTIIILFLLGLSVIEGSGTIGDFNYYQGIIGQVIAGLYMIIYNYGQIYDGKIRINNYLNFIHFENKVRDEGKIILNKSDFEIEFRNVSFKYKENSNFTLKNLNFKLNCNQKIALVGVNGSGKTSIIKLLLRFYDPNEGVILVDNKDIREYTVESLRKCFSPMFQDYCNYAFTVRENVSLSDYNEFENEEKIKYALDKSGAKGFVDNFPGKINTYLTRQYEDGEELSGGQWQKIALSRTFFRDTVMYILDEPSSALDAEAEDELFRQFEDLYKNKGAILISHRLSNVKSADKIIVIDNGKVIEQGTHKELMSLNKKYAHMYKLQAKKYE